MHITFSKMKNSIVARISGELDHHSSDEVRSKLDDKIEKEKIYNLILDFSNVTFMDSSGIGVVIGRYKKVAANKGSISIINANTTVKRVFELSGMFKIINLYDNLEQAIKNI